MANELSPEEEKHIFNLSLIPAGIVFLAFLIYLAYAMHYSLLETLWDFLWLVTSVFTVILAIIFLFFEVFYSRKFNQSFNLKRFAGRIMIMVIGLVLLIVVLNIFYTLQFLWTSEAITLLVSAITWFSIWFVLVITFKQAFRKLTRGQW